MNIVRSQFALLLHMGLAVTILLATAAFADHNQHHSTAFKGAKVNGGTASLVESIFTNGRLLRFR